jgi:multiple sugar transport system substrate-binding protein
MKYMFVILMSLLAIAALITRWTAPDARSDVPVLYWATDPNPARIEQIRLFHEWLVEEGHTDENGGPAIELRLDTVSGDPQKLIIQGVSGVAADIMDRGVPALEAYGLLVDITDEAEQMGFGLDQTFPALGEALTVNGRQYGFPCNVATVNFWVNKDAFERVGMDPPPQSWDFETFERIGKEFVKRANPPGERQTVFFCNALTDWYGTMVMSVMMRSLGLDIFNETVTASALDDERFARVLILLYKWTYEDRILPTAADVASISGGAGYGGAEFSMFSEGKYGMMSSGRWCLIRLREFENPPNLSISQFPCDQFDNANILTRAAGVYAGSAQQDKAMLFFEFLASEKYNMHIVESADSQPPNPRFTQTEPFLRPAEYPHEWGTHETIARIARTSAIADARCPYASEGSVYRALVRAHQEVMANRETPEEAAALAAQRINDDIQLNLAQRPALKERHDADSIIQRKIEDLLEQGEPIPQEWIRNPFHRAYYAEKGLLQP